MRATYWWLFLMLLLVAGVAGAAEEEAQFYLGVSRDIVLKTLGKPSFAYPPDQDGKELWYYGKAVVTMIKGQVSSWRNFPEQTPQRPEGAPAVRLGSTQVDVAQALGFPPSALRYNALIIGKKPVGEEEWSYRGGTLVFQDGLVVGWRNVTTPLISLGAPQPNAKALTLGSLARDVVARYGTPPTLTCYVASGDQLWLYPQEQYVMRGGKVSWFGPLQANTKPVKPPVREEAPPVAVEPGQQLPPANTGFINDPEFPRFRTAYERVVNKMIERTPRFKDTEEYRAIKDCLDQKRWWSIMAQADVDEEYANGVDMIEEAFYDYLDHPEKYR